MSRFPYKPAQWKPGQSGNPGGKTSAHRKAEIRAAELAAKAQLDLVEALSYALDNAKNNEEKIAQIRADVLKLLKDSQDRAYGVPKSVTELSNPDGTLAARSVTDEAVLAAIKAKHESDG